MVAGLVWLVVCDSIHFGKMVDRKRKLETVESFFGLHSVHCVLKNKEKHSHKINKQT